MLIHIEGNIASGKTKLLNGLKYTYETKKEQISNLGFCRLRSKSGELHFYYRLPSICFVQLMSIPPQQTTGKEIPDLEYEQQLIDERKMVIDAANVLKSNMIITDGGLTSGIIYSEALYNCGHLTRNEADILWKDVEDSHDLMPCLVIYLEVEPEVCFKRIRERNLAHENYIDMQFLKEIDREYHRYLFCWLTKKHDFINVSGSSEQNDELYETLLIHLIDLCSRHNAQYHTSHNKFDK